MEKRRYNGLDWLRTILCIGILIWHVKANCGYDISGMIYNRIIPAFDDAVYPFMAISAFGMCCGYYERTLKGQIKWTSFYAKRYMRILPYFAILVVFDMALQRTPLALSEGFTELTLLHGFIPNELSVMGIGWFLGTVFIFYLIFPFFCALIEKRSRAWIALAIAIGLSCIAIQTFGVHRKNFLVCFCYFLCGGVVFKYKDWLEKRKWYAVLPFSVLSVAAYFIIGSNPIVLCVVSGILLIQGLTIPGTPRPIAFLSAISMEIYLAHMAVFRAVEKLRMHTIVGNGWLQYLLTCTIVFCITTAYAYLMQKILRTLENKIGAKRMIQ